MIDSHALEFATQPTGVCVISVTTRQVRRRPEATARLSSPRVTWIVFVSRH